ncbi:hypothetical protein G7066_10460 [Leucobacter coleopterorum]|uniref:Uncharacterized protein n=1 Tax=Leucobacter coleopterorum TaxID=2714933 RepID=A0ABX6K118_9MICO|nr:hypothetical protein [Leucobacter coleopterorum]QIM18904.1 hypothetical protein G7066_10460 [Leucobacter coleopterorum]
MRKRNSDGTVPDFFYALAQRREQRLHAVQEVTALYSARFGEAADARPLDITLLQTLSQLIKRFSGSLRHFKHRP